MTAALLAAAGLCTFGTVPMFLVCLLVSQFFMDGSYSNLIPYAAEIYPVRMASLAMGLASAAGGAGKILGTVVLGLLAGAGNLVTPAATEQGIVPGFLFLAASALVTALGFTFLGIRRTAARNLDGAGERRAAPVAGASMRRPSGSVSGSPSMIAIIRRGRGVRSRRARRATRAPDHARRVAPAAAVGDVTEHRASRRQPRSRPNQ
jgi:hypothetical protein